MNRKNIYQILGSFLFLDLLIFLLCFYDLIVSLFFGGEPIMKYLSTVYRMLSILLIVCCISMKDDKCDKYLGNGNHPAWNMSKNIFIGCWVLKLVFAANPTMFELFKILTIVAGFMFILVQLWCIKTGRIS